MHQIADQWIELNKAHLDFAWQLTSVAFEGVQRVARAQLDMAAATLAALSGEIAPLADARDINGVLAVGARIVQPVLDKHAASVGEICGAIAESHMRAHALARDHVENVSRKMASALEQAIQAPDKGGDATAQSLGWMASALSTSADNFAQTTRQIAELAMANLSVPFHWVELDESQKSTEQPASHNVH